MKICLFTSSLNRGGAERVFVNLANHWIGQGHSVDFVVMSATGGFLKELDSEVRLIDLAKQRGRLPARLDFIRLFAKYLRKEMPDKVFATLTYVTITALWAAWLTRFKGQLVVRQANSIANQSSQSFGVRIWNWLGYFVGYRRADIILVNSKNSGSEVAEHFPFLKEKIRLVHNPVVLPPKRVKLQDYVQPIILTSGRFAKQKDYPTLLRAFKLVREQVDARLIILGDGPERLNIEKDIMNLEIAEFVSLKGSVRDPETYYKQADVFVLTSLWEGFPNVLVEALSYGIPVVATDSLGASREIVEPISPSNIVPTHDSEAIADRILRTLSMSIDSEELRQYVMKRFSIGQIATEYLEI